MKKITYNKLIRKKIVDLIKETGREPIYLVLDNEDYIQALKAKLIEKVNMLFFAFNEKNKENELEEYADLSEVLLSVADILKINLKKAEKLRIEKKEKKGGYDGRIFLKDIIEYDTPITKTQKNEKK